MQSFLPLCVLLFILHFVRSNGATINFNTSLIPNANNFNLMDPTIYNEGVIPGPLDTVNIFSGTGFTMISFYVPANASFTIGELLVNGSAYTVNLYGNLTVTNANLGNSPSELTNFLNVYQNIVLAVSENFWLSVHMHLMGGSFQQIASPLHLFVADQNSEITIEAQSSFVTNVLAYFMGGITYKVSNSYFASNGSTVVQGGSFLVANSDMFLGELIIENTVFADFFEFDAYSVSLISSTATFSIPNSDNIQFINVDSNSTWVLSQADAVIGNPNSVENPIQGNGTIQITSSSLTLYNLNYLECEIQFSGPGNALTFYAASNFTPSVFTFVTPDASATITQMSGETNLVGNWSIVGNWVLQAGTLNITGDFYLLQNSSIMLESTNMISGQVFFEQTNSTGTPTLLGFQNITVGTDASMTVLSPTEMAGNVYNFGLLALSITNVLQLSGNLQQNSNSTLYIYDYNSSNTDSIPLDISGSINIQGTLYFEAPKITTKTSYVILTADSIVGTFDHSSNVAVTEPHVKFNLVYASNEINIQFVPVSGHHGLRWWGVILILLSIGIVGAGGYMLVRRWRSGRHRFVLIQ